MIAFSHSKHNEKIILHFLFEQQNYYLKSEYIYCRCNLTENNNRFYLYTLDTFKCFTGKNLKNIPDSHIFEELKIIFAEICLKTQNNVNKKCRN